MAKIIKGQFGKSGHKSGWAKFGAENRKDYEKPDMERPTDVDVPDYDKGVPDDSRGPEVPPSKDRHEDDGPHKEPNRHPRLSTTNC